MYKDIKFKKEAREKLLKGVNVLADAVVATMGAKGRNVAMEQGQYNIPKIVHDGVSVANEIFLEDRHENMGANLVKQAAKKTNDIAGDGTTTATLLAQVIVNEGDKAIQNGESPMTLREDLLSLSRIVIEQLKKDAKKIKTKEEIASVANVSSASEEIGNLVAEAVDRVGKNGLVVVEEGRETKTEVIYKDGFEFATGYLSPYFISNPNKTPMTSEISDAYIMVTNKKMSMMDDDMITFLNYFVANCGQQKNLVIIAEEVSGEALAGLVINRLRGVINVLAVRAPEYGENRKQVMEDIAILTGAKLLLEEDGTSLTEVTMDYFGKADKVEASDSTTKIIGGKGIKKAIKSRIKELEEKVKNTKDTYAREKLQERLAKLLGGVAVINVGATTEVELKDAKERVVDAVGSAQSAVQEGIVAGGGIELLRLSQVLKDTDLTSTAGRVMIKALEAPFYKILENAGYEGSIDKIKEAEGDFGYDIVKKEYGSLIQKGIIDPVKVTRTALENAVSIATMILTTEVSMTEGEKKNDA